VDDLHRAAARLERAAGLAGLAVTVFVVAVVVVGAFVVSALYLLGPLFLPF
jgi:hypothetical protein